MYTRKFGLLVFLAALTVGKADAQDVFPSCRFHFGTEWYKAQNNPALLQQVDHLTGPWIGSSETFNAGSYYTYCRNNNKVPVNHTYVIAFAARRDWGLQDCNVSSADNLCQRGADYIRQNRTKILGIYATFAKGVAQAMGPGRPSVWLMEADYTQYTEASQQGGGLTYEQAGQLMKDMVSTVKANCPAAVFSMDISPWRDTTWQKTWYAAMGMDQFTFIHTSGGASRGDTKYISDSWSTRLPTWSWTYRTFGKPILADAGYGVGGAGTGHDARWDDVANLTNRIHDGVVGIAQVNPATDWATTISGIRSQLPAPPSCSNNSNKPPVISLTAPVNNATFTAPASVTITAGASDPDGSIAKVEFFNGSTKLGESSATPYSFAWNSVPAGPYSITARATDNQGATATSTPITITVNGTVSSYALTTSIVGQGTITRFPNASSYSSGTPVSLTATPAAGYVFSGWSGAISGSANPSSVTMSSNREVTATFTQQQTSELVKNGTFSSGASPWILGVYGTAAATGTVTNGEYVIGSSKAGSADWNVQFMQSGLRLEQGRTYILAFDARASGSQKIMVGMGMSISPYTSYLGGFNADLTAIRRRFTRTFTMQQSTDANARIVFNTGLSKNTVYIDNVGLMAVSQNQFMMETDFVNVLKPPSTMSISFSRKGLTISSPVQRNMVISLYDTRGRLVSDLFRGKINAGSQVFSVSSVSAGDNIIMVKDGAGKKLFARNLYISE